MTQLVLGAVDSGAAVDCTVGDQLVVRLPENPTTGYRWEPIDLPAILELADDSFELDQPTAVGSGGTRQLTFACAAGGDAELRFQHLQPWEGESSVTAEVRYVLRVSNG